MTPLTRRRARAASLVALCSTLPATSACSVYDIKDALAALDAGGDDEEHVELADTCYDAVIPTIESREAELEATLDTLSDDIRSMQACGMPALLPGPDGFMRLEVAAGERWHLEAEPVDPTMDLALYILSSCDELSCRVALDRCGPGFEEDFTYVSNHAESLFFGVDTHGASGEIDLLALRVRCGDGVQQHGEACDEGDIANGDGCDALCRLELTDDQVAEREPNNWSTEANVLMLPSQSQQVIGKLGGPCDEDWFAIDVPEGAALHAVVGDGAGSPCDAGHEALHMRIVDGTLGTEVAVGTSGGEGGACPAVAAGDSDDSALAAGEYHVILSSDAAESFDYRLTVELIPAT